MINKPYIYLAQAYGEGAYSTSTYQSTAGSASSDSGISAPSTGFMNSGTEILAPIILGASILVAVAAVAIKRHIRIIKARN